MNLKEFFQRYAARTDWKLLPIYIGLACLTLWLGAVSVLLLGETGASAARMDGLSTAASVLALLFAVWPFARPLVELATESWFGEWWVAEL